MTITSYLVAANCSFAEDSDLTTMYIVVESTKDVLTKYIESVESAINRDYPQWVFRSVSHSKRLFVGDRVCTVTRSPKMAGRYPIWIGGIYEARERKSDGQFTWRKIGTYGRSASGYTPSLKLIQDLREIADYPFVKGIRHGMLIN